MTTGRPGLEPVPAEGGLPRSGKGGRPGRAVSELQRSPFFFWNTAGSGEPVKFLAFVPTGTPVRQAILDQDLPDPSPGWQRSQMVMILEKAL